MMQCQSKITVVARIIALYAWWLPNGHRVGPTVTPMRRVSESALIHDFYKRHQIAIMRVKFQFQKVSNCINMISTSFSLTIKGYPDKHY